MRTTDDSTRILRTAAGIWLGFLFAMALMDIALYMPQIQRLLGDSARLQPTLPNQPLPLNPIGNLPNQPLRGPYYPVYLRNGTASTSGNVRGTGTRRMELSFYSCDSF